MNQPLRILLMGDYSNCHRTLATGLRSLGHDVTVVSDGSKWQNTARDIDIARHGKSRAAGLELMLRLRYGIMPRLRNFDIVAIHNPGFLNLRPVRTKYFFDRLKGENRSIFLTAMGTDSAYLDLCSAADSPLRYTEWFIDGHPSPLYLSNPAKWRDWHNDEIRSFHEYVYDNIDEAVSILYEYHLAITRALGPTNVHSAVCPSTCRAYSPSTSTPTPRSSSSISAVTASVASRKAQMCSKQPRATSSRAMRDASLCRLSKICHTTDISRQYAVITSLSTSSTATRRQPTPCWRWPTASTPSAAPSLNSTISFGEPAGDPVINAPVDYDRLVETLDAIVSDPRAIAPRGRRSRQFVERHHDCRHVAQRFLDFWTSKL